MSKERAISLCYLLLGYLHSFISAVSVHLYVESTTAFSIPLAVFCFLLALGSFICSGAMMITSAVKEKK